MQPEETALDPPQRVADCIQRRMAAPAEPLLYRCRETTHLGNFGGRKNPALKPAQPRAANRLPADVSGNAAAAPIRDAEGRQARGAAERAAHIGRSSEGPKHPSAVPAAAAAWPEISLGGDRAQDSPFAGWLPQGVSAPDPRVDADPVSLQPLPGRLTLTQYLADRQHLPGMFHVLHLSLPTSVLTMSLRSTFTLPIHTQQSS